MQIAYTADQIRAAEAPLLAAGVPLMDRAAAGLAREIEQKLARRPNHARPSRILVLVGSGNNGGDALFACAILASAGAEVAILPVGSRLHEAGLAAALKAGVALESPVSDADAAAIAQCAAGRSDVVIDGILGIGVTDDPRLRGRARAVVEAILGHRANDIADAEQPLIVAVDLPSGIDADTGAAPDGIVLPADLTVTFGGLKAGLLQGAGAELAGEVRLIDIGLDLTDRQPGGDGG
jgi:hydroxyethylthiazole kinase-like uncharacterized protein yjeF